MMIESSCTSLLSVIISSTQWSSKFSPFSLPEVVIRFLKSSTLSGQTLCLFLSSVQSCLFRILRDSIKSSKVSLVLGLRAISEIKLFQSKLPDCWGSTSFYISATSRSVGLKLRPRTIVPSSLVVTQPSAFLSNKVKISLISAIRTSFKTSAFC